METHRIYRATLALSHTHSVSLFFHSVWEWKRIVRHLIYIYIYTIIITIIDYHVGNSKKFRK